MTSSNIFSKIYNPRTKSFFKWFLIIWILSLMISVPNADLGFFVFNIPLISAISLIIFETLGLISIVNLIQNKISALFYISLLFTFLISLFSGIISSISIMEITDSIGLVGRLIRNIWYIIPISFAIKKLNIKNLKENLAVVTVGLAPFILYFLKIVDLI